MNVSSVLNQSASQAVEPLNVADRCDLCGARAYMRAVLMNGPLLFAPTTQGQFRGAARPGFAH